MDFKKIMEKIKSDGHVPVALFVFAVTTVIHVKTQRDLGANYVNSLYAFYGFLAGHKWAQDKYQPDVATIPDQTQQKDADTPKQ